VGCDQYREALSADLDGEPGGVPESAVQAHLRACAGCRSWYADAGRMSRLVRLAPAEPMPDLAPAVLAAAGPIRPPASRFAAAARAALVAVALVQALLAWPGTLTGQDGLASGHVAHEVGAWNLALAVAFLAAASRPRTAEALITPVAVFVAVLGVAAVADGVAGTLQASRFAVHLLVAAGLALLVAVSRTQPPQPELSPGNGSRPGSRTGGSDLARRPGGGSAAAGAAPGPALRARSAGTGAGSAA
jgi:predicted anti-sigma-YlaC factor YlaD